jgi:predicted ATPase
MLKSLHIQNLTVFREADLEFGANLNVIVGENGSGKTHLLKAAYAGIAASAEAHDDWIQSFGEVHRFEIKAKFAGVFRTESLLNLIHRRKSDVDYHVNSPLALEYKFDPPGQYFKFKIGNQAFPFRPDNHSRSFQGNVATEYEYPDTYVDTRPIYFPTRELLSIYPGFVPLYETTHLPFEETWRDTAILLGAPLAKGSREKRIGELLKPIEEAMGGTLVLDDSGRFYLRTENAKIEMHLVAEGFRKLAMVARLIATGSLLDKGYLFWDEPESNLNPRIIKTLARTILQVAASGIQVFIATHSLFLLREIHILHEQEFKNLDTRFFGLHIQKGDGVTVQQGKTMDDVGSITALEEDLQQSERYIDTEMGVRTNCSHHESPND